MSDALLRAVVPRDGRLLLHEGVIAEVLMRHGVNYHSWIPTMRTKTQQNEFVVQQSCVAKFSVYINR